LGEKESFFDLRAYICAQCLLVQLEEFETPEQIFSDYAYFSSYSATGLQHAKDYVEKMVHRFSLGSSHHVVEVASNDGYLLQYFQEKNIPILGIEPARNVAEVARKKGIPTLVEFFGAQMASGLNTKADLLLGNNVLAHVPNLNDFVKGLKILLADTGIITLEFPHLLQLVQYNQFDTIYHEHFSYFSLLTIEKIFAAHNLLLFDVEELSTHGGSLRIYMQHSTASREVQEGNIAKLRQKERSAGLERLQTYLTFQRQAFALKEKLRSFLLSIKRLGKTVAAYGAPAKGNTLLNFCQISTDLLPYTVDVSPHKQGRYLPGTRIPIFSPDKIFQTKPDYLLILPWNLKEEIVQQMQGIAQWGGQFVCPIPDVEVFS
jgi:2-polyprenyl-3-methyl-5-hydroxy-6-metoxy-1,4-benzoquinol methylase